MAISRPVRPELLVAGRVVGSTPRRRFDESTRKYTDEVIGYEVLVLQESGAQVSIRYKADDRTPEVLAPVAVFVDVNESREYGASLAWSRNVSPDDLDKINSSLSVPAGAKG